MRQLVPGGVLAIQMPRNFAAPSHVLMRETAAEEPWAQRLAPLLRADPVAPPDFYYGLLTPLARGGLDLWETEYLHVLAGAEGGDDQVDGADDVGSLGGHGCYRQRILLVH